MPLAVQYTVLIYVYKGELTIGSVNRTLQTGQFGQLIKVGNIHLETLDKSASCLALVLISWQEPLLCNQDCFMNSIEEIEPAIRDCRDGVLTQWANLFN